MSESKTPSELTEPGDRTEAMMYWHERAMKAEADLAAARAEVERLRKELGAAHELLGITDDSALSAKDGK